MQTANGKFELGKVYVAKLGMECRIVKYEGGVVIQRRYYPGDWWKLWSFYDANDWRAEQSMDGIALRTIDGHLVPAQEAESR